MPEKNVITLISTIETLTEKKKYAALREILITLNPADIAAIFAELKEAILPLLFRLIPKEQAAETFVEMDSDLQELLIKGFSDSELKEVIDELYVDDAVDIVEEMPANVVKRILMQADPDMRKMINEILKYPEDSAGSIMTTEFVDLRPQMTVAEAIKHIRRTGIDKETINTCYVMDKNRKLIGMISIRTLIISDDEAVIGEIMETNVISIATMEDQESVAQMFSKYNFLAMPVVDKEERLVGIITIDDAIDVMEEETTEDIEKMAAIVPSDKPYLKTSIFSLWKGRILWLLILMLSATFTSMIINHYEAALQAQVALAAFIPMLMNTAGNAGSQASVTVIRGISLGELSFRDLPTILWKEFGVSLLCGITLSVCNFLKLIFIEQTTIPIALAVCLTLLITIVCAKLVGCILPIVAKKLKLDPAVMSSPFVTTIVDIVSLLIYFAVASALLSI